MALFLKIVSAVYLAVVWLLFIAVAMRPTGLGSDYTVALAFLIAVSLSVPAVALFAFGQLVGDVREMTGHLAAMRGYYEPRRDFH